MMEIPASQAGIDISTDSGFYAGTWVGDITWDGASYELDVYGGYAGEAGAVAYDVGYIQYMYPDKTTDADFGEVYVGFWAQDQSQFHIIMKLIMMTAQLIAVTILICHWIMAWISQKTGV